MSAELDIHARLAAWRKDGADRIEPVRFAVMTALARRALEHEGRVRQVLEARLETLATDYADILAKPVRAKPPSDTGGSPLAALLPAFDNAPHDTVTPPVIATTGKAPTEIPVAGTTPLPVLDEFQQLWTRIRIDSLLRQCLDSLPEDAGPLHSNVLTYRAMALMRDISPDYLQHFVAYADVLSWLEVLRHKATPSRRPRSDT